MAEIATILVKIQTWIACILITYTYISILPGIIRKLKLLNKEHKTTTTRARIGNYSIIIIWGLIVLGMWCTLFAILKVPSF